MSSEVDTGGFLASTGGITLTNATLSGTTTLTGFTRGSVLFAGASSAVSQDNANFFFDDAVSAAGNYQLGIGTATPSGVLGTTAVGVALVASGTTTNIKYYAANTGTSLNASTSFQAFSDFTGIQTIAHGSAQSTTRFGVTIAGYSEILSGNAGANTSNGLIIGTQQSAPLILGTNSLNQLQISGNGFVTVTNSFSVGGVLGLTPATWVDNQTTAAGQISVDANYIYVATATNTVKRVALTSF